MGTAKMCIGIVEVCSHERWGWIQPYEWVSAVVSAWMDECMNECLNECPAKLIASLNECRTGACCYYKCLAVFFSLSLVNWFATLFSISHFQCCLLLPFKWRISKFFSCKFYVLLPTNSFVIFSLSLSLSFWLMGVYSVKRCVRLLITLNWTVC